MNITVETTDMKPKVKYWHFDSWLDEKAVNLLRVMLRVMTDCQTTNRATDVTYSIIGRWLHVQLTVYVWHHVHRVTFCKSRALFVICYRVIELTISLSRRLTRSSQQATNKYRHWPVFLFAWSDESDISACRPLRWPVDRGQHMWLTECAN